jgi:hypothetical protein
MEHLGEDDLSARWLAVSSAVASLGGLLAVSWLIYAKQEHATYFQWPGILGVTVTGVGFVGLIVGLLLPDHSDVSSQVQQGGSSSINLQAGRDIRIGREAKGDQE